MEKVPFHDKIKTPFSYQINVIKIATIKNKVLYSKKTQKVNEVSL